MTVRVRLATDELDALDRLTQLPHLDDESNTRGSEDDPRGASVDQVEEDDGLEEEIEEHRAKGEPFHRLVLLPEGDVVLEGENVQQDVQQAATT